MSLAIGQLHRGYLLFWYLSIAPLSPCPCWGCRQDSVKWWGKGTQNPRCALEWWKYLLPQFDSLTSWFLSKHFNRIWKKHDKTRVFTFLQLFASYFHVSHFSIYFEVAISILLQLDGLWDTTSALEWYIVIRWYQEGRWKWHMAGIPRANTSSNFWHTVNQTSECIWKFVLKEIDASTSFFLEA